MVLTEYTHPLGPTQAPRCSSELQGYNGTLRGRYGDEGLARGMGVAPRTEEAEGNLASEKKSENREWGKANNYGQITT